MEKFASTTLLIREGSRAPVPPPGVVRAEASLVAVLLKTTLSVAIGAPGNCQFAASDQFMLRFGTSAPDQIVVARCPTGPAVIVSRMESWSTLSERLPTYVGVAVGSAPSVAL